MAALVQIMRCERFILGKCFGRRMSVSSRRDHAAGAVTTIPGVEQWLPDFRWATLLAVVARVRAPRALERQTIFAMGSFTTWAALLAANSN